MQAIKEYHKRLDKFSKINIIEVADEKTGHAENESLNEQIRLKEGRRILEKIPMNSYIICLDIYGKSYDSIGFAKHISDIMMTNSCITWIIGGSVGLSDEVLQKSNELISFSRQTFPHQLMRVIFMEQLYRSYKIINNEPYHK